MIGGVGRMCLPSRGMALRSHSATSGPGRAPASDPRSSDARSSGIRARHGHGRGGRRLRRRVPESVRSTALRRRAEALLAPAPRPVRPGGRGLGPPGREPLVQQTGGPAATDVPAPRPSRNLSAPTHLSASTRPSAPATGASTDAPAPDGEATGGVGMRVGRVRSAVRERLPVWVQSRCGLEPRTLAALAVVLVVAAVFAAQHFWTGRPQPVQPPEVVGEGPAAARPEPSPGPPPTVAADGPGPVPGEGRIVIDVSGKVRQPGIHRLPAGSRVADALRAAGGVKAGADTVGLNRARLLMDGEQVVVGVPGPAGAAGPVVGGGASASGRTAAPIGLGSATAEQLETLPGVGPVLAQHIIDYRTEHGGFRSVDELREVKGIGDRRFADLRPLVRP